MTFTLPAAEADGTTPVVSGSPSRKGREQTSVFVVDDDPHSLRQSRDALAAVGYAPATTGQIGDGSRLSETKKPALVMLDLVLPGADAVGLMRTRPAPADLPVVFVSAYGAGSVPGSSLCARGEPGTTPGLYASRKSS